MDENELGQAPPASLGSDVPVCRAMPAAVDLRAETRADDDPPDGSPGTMVGNFSTFNDWYEINSWFEGNFLERIAPGAFKRTMNSAMRANETPVRVLLDHGYDPELGDKPLGVPTVLEERDSGAYAEVPLFEGVPQLVVSGLRAGAYGQSFRFAVLRDEWVEEPEPSETNKRGIPERTITEVRLIEFGPTPFPANPNSDAGLRSTTDAFYDRLRSKHPEQYADYAARAANIRIPKTPAATSDEDRNEDPQPTRHSQDPPSQETSTPARHSEDPPSSEHSTERTQPATSEGRTDIMDETMTVDERVQRQSEIRARLTEIDGEYRGGTLPDDIQAEWDRLTDEFDSHAEAIVAAEARREQLDRLADNQDGEQAGPTRRATGTSRQRSNGPAVQRRSENIYDLAEIRRQARSMDELPMLYRDAAMRVVEAAHFAGSADRAQSQGNVERLLRNVDDEFGTLARRVIATGSPTYDRAFGKAVIAGNTDGLTTEERAALSTTNANGGFAVPFDLDPTVILTSSGVVNPLRGISRVEQVVGNTWQGITSAGVTVSRGAESSEVGDNAPTIGQPDVKVEKVHGFIPFTMEIEGDWQRMRSELTMMLADGKDTEEAGSFLNGNGTTPNPEGLLTGATQTVQVATSGVLASTDLYALEEAVPNRFRPRAQFIADRKFYNTVRELGADSDGGNLWVRLGQGLPPELIGYPAREASEMPAVNLSLDTSVLAVLGDFQQFLIVDKVGMQVELVAHLFGASRRPTGERGIYAHWRNSCKVLVDGAFRKLMGNTP